MAGIIDFLYIHSKLLFLLGRDLRYTVHSIFAVAKQDLMNYLDDIY